MSAALWLTGGSGEKFVVRADSIVGLGDDAHKRSGHVTKFTTVYFASHLRCVEDSVESIVQLLGWRKLEPSIATEKRTAGRVETPCGPSCAECDNSPVTSPVAVAEPPTCNVASEATQGVYICTRESGHGGPCAAHLVPPGMCATPRCELITNHSGKCL